MKPTTPTPEKETGEDALTRMALDMISKGETSRTLIGYDVNLTLAVTPKFIDKVKECGR